METNQAIKLALALLEEHGLQDWRVTLDNAVQRLGRCTYGTKTISLSGKLITLNSEATVRNTILHEIAHALVGPGHGHDAVWQRQARAIGCTGDRQSRAVAPQARWVGTCPSGHTMKRHRLTAGAKNGSCATCSPIFNAAYRFTWVDTRVAG